MSLMQKLQNLKKGAKTMTEYLLEINTTLETLAVARKKNTDADLVLLMLAGLGEKYESLIQNVTSRSDKVTYKMLQVMLTDLEIRKHQMNVKNPLSINVVEESNMRRNLENFF